MNPSFNKTITGSWVCSNYVMIFRARQRQVDDGGLTWVGKQTYVNRYVDVGWQGQVGCHSLQVCHRQAQVGKYVDVGRQTQIVGPRQVVIGKLIFVGMLMQVDRHRQVGKYVDVVRQTDRQAQVGEYVDVVRQTEIGRLKQVGRHMQVDIYNRTSLSYPALPGMIQNRY